MTTPSIAPVLTVEHLTVSAQDVELVHDVSFTMTPGQRVGIIGASGSGKTLTAMAISGLLPQTLGAAGSIRFSGFAGDVVHASESAMATVRGRLSGMVFQEPMTALNPTMRVDKQVAEALRIHGTSAGRRDRHQRVLGLLQAVGLPDAARIARSFPHQLSGGQRQRIVIAMAMANSPAVLICDEPTTALDVTVQATVLDLIDERTAANGSALLFISHDLTVVASICDYVLVMWQGRVVERGPVTTVLTAPQHPHTRQLLADAQVATGGVPLSIDASASENAPSAGGET